jgi:hypothetical protein
MHKQLQAIITVLSLINVCAGGRRQSLAVLCRKEMTSK